jgi:hypothetical protein
VSVTPRLAERLPEVPLIVNCDALATAELAAVRVRVLVELVLDGLKDAVTPVGKPLVVSATVPLNPPCGATLTVVVT